MTKTNGWSPLFRGAAVALALLTLGAYVFISSCTRPLPRPEPGPTAADLAAPGAAAPPPATPVYLPATKSAVLQVIPEGPSRPATAANAVHAKHSILLPEHYMSTTKSGIMHVVPAPAQPAPTQAAVRQQAP